jgi:outer membrane protein assembly factor BamB
MSSQPTDNDTAATNAIPAVHKPIPRLRIWPALVILLVQFVAAQILSFFGSTDIHSAVSLAVIPLSAAVLLLIWWLAASRAPVLDRIIGLLLLAGAIWCIKYSRGVMLLSFAVPAMTTGLVLTLAVTSRLRWTLARWVTVAYVLGCAGVFMAMRVDEIGSGLAPVVSWRWSPTKVETSAAIPVLKANGTAALPAQAGPSDWPAFRGPLRDGILTGTTFSTDWSTPPRELWRKPVGSGYSSFIAVGDYVFTQEQRGPEELVTCYQAATGADVWVNRTAAEFKDDMGLGPRATPTFSDGKLYTLGCTGMLQCLDAATGNAVWKHDLPKEAETRVPSFGHTGSPLVMGGLVIVFCGRGEGKSAVAFDRATGKAVWRAGHETEVYTSPQYAELLGVPQVLMVCDYGLQSFALDTGALLIDYPWKAKLNNRGVQPAVVDDRIMVATTGFMNTRMLRVQKDAAAWTVREEWDSKKFRPYFNNGALHKGFYYGFDGERLACLDIATGERRWEGKRYGGQLLVLADMEMLLVLSDTGDAALVPATPERFSETARFKAVSGKTWSDPVVAHGRLFVRNTTEAACFALPLL